MKKDRFVKYLDNVRDNLVLKVGEMNVSYTIAPNKISELPKITMSRDIYEFLIKIWEPDIIAIERFKCIYLNKQNRILGYLEISKGVSHGTIMDNKSILGPALCLPDINSIIVCHNHPSGSIQPSDADKNITKQLKEACKIMSIPLIDSLIITPEHYFSFLDEGIL
jgi:DNA repair protein RadC